MQPHLFAEVTLYPNGGRAGPIIGPVFKCPCKLTKEADYARDCQILLDGEPILLGKPRKVGFAFLSSEGADVFRVAGKFYLWEGTIIGEAVVVPSDRRRPNPKC